MSSPPVHTSGPVQDPFLPDPGIFAAMLLITVAVVGTRQERVFGPDQVLLFLDCGRDPADPERVLPQSLQVGCGVKGRISHMVDLFIGVQVLVGVLDDGQDRLFV